MKVEKGIPIPSSEVGRPSVYPWADMDVGSSFFVKKISLNSMSAAARRRGQSHNEKYTARTVTENGIKGVRVWRVE
jgi:hypothetical protein